MRYFIINFRNQKMIFIFPLPVFIIIIGFLLNGCAPAAITAGIAGVAASESEKGLGTTINDTIIHASILRFIVSCPSLFPLQYFSLN